MMLDGMAVKSRAVAVSLGATGVSCRAGQRPDMHFAIPELIDDSREAVEMAPYFFVLEKIEAARRPYSGGVP